MNDPKRLRIRFRRNSDVKRISEAAPPIAVRRSKETRRKIVDGLALLKSIRSAEDLVNLGGNTPTVTGFKKLTRTGSEAFNGPNSDLRPLLEEELLRLASLVRKASVLKASRQVGRKARPRSRKADEIERLKDKNQQLQSLLAARDADNLRLIYLLECERKDSAHKRRR